ncbi:MAG: hypothetical protein NZ954_05720 [Thermofilaceae archaeon]|nr:hypothetical protein [Thermofilaceae archaeon]MCX8179890.1 hypothetical protein [Thermofilaceae archaeon]MDW8004425.1 hypothetical protein [Thermofilaceae archaeon]
MKLLLVLLLLFPLVAQAKPTYVSQNFEVYDRSGAGVAYAQTVSRAFEEILSLLSSRGVSLASPCSSSRYVVNVVEFRGQEKGYTRSQYMADRDGRVVSSCVLWINVSKGLSEVLLKRVASHELLHVAQAHYIRYITIVNAYPWYVEASAEGMTSSLLSSCSWEGQYFQYTLYSYNPYSFSGSDQRCYALSAFYHWILSTGYATMPEALSNSFSGDVVEQPWVNSAYVSFLLSLAKGMIACGTSYQPQFTKVYLPRGSWSAQVTLNGLSAVYYRIELPSPGPVIIQAPRDLESNLALNQPFTTSNTTLLFALVNPSLATRVADVTVSFEPPLEARIVSGLYDAWNRTLTLKIYVTYSGQPVTGTIFVSGLPAAAYQGYAVVTFKEIVWEDYSIEVSYAEKRTTVSVNLRKPSVDIETETPLYISRNSSGEIVVRLRNNGNVNVKTEVSLSPSAYINSTIVQVEAKPGETKVNLPFKVTQTPQRSSTSLLACFGVNECTQVPIETVPVNITLVKATYDSTSNTTYVEAVAYPLPQTLKTEIRGLKGSASFRKSTYTIGTVHVSFPPPKASLTAQPLVVAPSWVLLAVNVSFTNSSSCPAHPLNFKVNVNVNETRLGVLEFPCGGEASISSTLNASYNKDRPILALQGNNVGSFFVNVPLPELNTSVLEWVITDSGSVVKAKLEVRGSCRYLLLGRVVSNESIEIQRELTAGEMQLVIDAGFRNLTLPMPNVKLELYIPRINLSNQPVRGRLKLKTVAEVNAYVEIRLNGEVLERVHLLKKAGEEADVPLTIRPEKLGQHNLTARAWFASSENVFLYVDFNELKVQAPQLVLASREGDVKVTLSVNPPLPLPINVSLIGCGQSLRKEVEANSTITLRFDEACTLEVKAEFLNYTSVAKVQWDKLVIGFDHLLGLREGTPIVSNGTLKLLVRLSNGTRVSARLTVNGEQFYDASKPGFHNVRVSAEYLGCVNETSISFYSVPERLYLEATELVVKLNKSGYLTNVLDASIVDGRWLEIQKFLETYNTAVSRTAFYDPVAYIAARLAEKWANEGDSTALNLAITMLNYELLIYLSVIAITAIFILRKRAVDKQVRRTTSPEEN